MSAHVLLNLLKKVEKGIMLSILSIFRYKFDKGPRTVLMKDCP